MMVKHSPPDSPADPSIFRPLTTQREVDDEVDVSILEKKYEESREAFKQWQISQSRTDDELYMVIGRLAELAAAVGNDYATLAKFAADKGVRVTKASSRFTVIAKLVMTADRKKANKYATVLRWAASRGVHPTADSVENFLKQEGGVEACLKAFRDARGKKGTKDTSSSYSKAIGQIENVARVEIPVGIQTKDLSGGYFLVVGVRDADGMMHLLQEPVTDALAVRKVISVLAAKQRREPG